MKIHVGAGLFLLLFSFAAYGQNHSSPPARPSCLDGFPVSTQSGDQITPAATSDGHGGFIIAWQDNRDNVPKVYAQHLDSTGAQLWPSGGVRVSFDTTMQLAPMIVSDFAGGAVIEWQDDGVVPIDAPDGSPSLVEYTRSFSSQRLDPSGNRLWGDQGVVLLLVHATYDPYALNMNSKGITDIAPDGTGGALYLTWEFIWMSSHSYRDLLLGHVSGSGSLLWDNVGIAVSTETLPLSRGQIVPDGLGGAIVSWTYAKYVNNTDVGFNKLSASRVDGTGTTVWSTSPLIDAAEQSIFSYDMSPDDSGGVYLCWDGAGPYPAPFTADRNIEAQRIDVNGLRRLGPSGIAVCSAPGLQTNPMIMTIPGGGAIAAWQDFRNDANDADLYAARITSTGALPWTNDGVHVAHSDSTPGIRGVVSDPQGGATIVWNDLRTSAPGVYAQSLSGSGKVRWQLNGSPVITGMPGLSQTAVSANNVGRAFVVWQDKRNQTDFDIFGQWTDVHAILQSGALAVAVHNIPGYGDAGTDVSVALFDGNQTLTDTRATDSDGIARFTSVLADTGYSIRVEYVPTDPTKIYGKEYWGGRSKLAVSVAETTTVDFQRNAPYTSKIRVYNAETNQLVTGGTPFGATVRVSIEITNPDAPGSAPQAVKCTLAVDRDKIPGYDFQDTSAAQPMAIGAMQTFDFTFLPQDSGSFFHVAGAEIEQAGTFIQTEGGCWGTFPAFIVDPPPPGGVLITVRTDPPGRSFVADDSMYADAKTFVWITGSSHTIGTTSTQSPHAGMQYRWTQWSDGDSAMHAVTTPSARTTYTAMFDTMYYLTMAGGTGGEVAPTSGWYRFGSAVTIHAKSAAGWRFVRWTGTGAGAYNGVDTVASVLVDSVISESATFEPSTGIAGLPRDVPTTFSLEGNYPNPFNPTTMIRFGVPTRAVVRLVVYTLLGQQVAELINGEVAAGYHDVRFDSNNLASGIYIYRITADKFVQTKKLIVLR